MAAIGGEEVESGLTRPVYHDGRLFSIHSYELPILQVLGSHPQKFKPPLMIRTH